METIAIHRSLQLFISTHSPVFQLPNSWQEPSCVFEATTERIEKSTSAWRILDALGIKSSDISQSNGVIWIEGPSDRWYIKHWLKIFYRESSQPELKENVDYSFSFYGGSLLSHLSISDSDSFIDMLRINRNLVIVMDRDKDFLEDDEKNLICKNPESAKARILAELKNFNSHACHAWITDEYTIESYLPAPYRRQYFEDCDERLVQIKGRKMAIAAEYTGLFDQMANCTDMPEKLSRHISTLHQTITYWNT
jgi:hypothetical protein